MNFLKAKHFLIFFICSILFGCEDNSLKSKDEKPPNIIYILADDLGYGDLSVFGQKYFKTPNIDKLAKEGMIFTQHYSGSTVCAPSRSTLLTGLHTGHTPIRGNQEVRPEGQWPMPDSIYTIAELFKDNGYVTGAFGKWGLGYPGSEGDPLNQGFDKFFGYNCQRLAHHYYPYYLWDNNEKVILKENEGYKKGQYAPNLIHEEAIKFINKNKDNPFFLYYPAIIPHAELAAPEAYMDKFKRKFTSEKPFKGLDGGEHYRDGIYESQTQPHTAFAAMITLLDDHVGDIIKEVKKLGLEKKTIIIFTSDNGPHKEAGADPDFFNSNAGFRGYKRDLFEGGIRVPMIIKWKGQIKEGSETDHISAFWDVFPTFEAILNKETTKKSDGISFLPTLLEKSNQQKHHYLYWEFHELGGRQAVRKDQWKLVKYDVLTEPTYFLFNLETDSKEQNNLIDEFPDKSSELIKILENARTESKYFKFKKK